MTLRARMAMLFIVSLVVVITVVGFVALGQIHRALFDEVDDRLLQLVHAGPSGPPVARGDAPPVVSDPSSPDQTGRSVAVLLVGPDGSVDLVTAAGFDDAPLPPPALPADLSDASEPMTTRAVTGDLRYRVMAARPDPVGGSRLVWAVSLASTDAAIRRTTWWVAVAGLATAVVGATASWLIVRRELRPLDTVVRVADAFAAGDLTARVPTLNRTTEIGRLTAGFNALLEATDASRHTLRNFIADVGHDIRTPVTTISGYVDLYRRGALSEPAELDRMVERIGSANLRIDTLLYDLSLLADHQSGRPFEWRDVDLAGVVAELADDAAAIEPQRPIRVQVAPNAVVHGDRTRLTQAIANLLDNVRAHTPTHAELDVAVTVTGDIVTLAVADDGPGLDPAALGAVFERGVRSSRSSGRGLGLAIVRSIVVNHGGSVGVANRSPRGLVVTLHLPSAAGHQPTSEPKNQAPRHSERRATSNVRA